MTEKELAKYIYHSIKDAWPNSYVGMEIVHDTLRFLTNDIEAMYALNNLHAKILSSGGDSKIKSLKEQREPGDRSKSAV